MASLASVNTVGLPRAKDNEMPVGRSLFGVALGMQLIVNEKSCYLKLGHFDFSKQRLHLFDGDLWC